MLHEFIEPKYLSINRDQLLLTDLSIEFDIYARPAGNSVDRPVLLFSKNTPSEKVRATLARKDFGDICILEKDYKKYWHFLEVSMKRIVEDEHVGLEQKSSLIYSCATDTVKTVFQDPRSGENINRTKSVTNTIIDFAFGNRESISSLLKLGSHDYYTFTHCVNVAVFGIGLWLAIGRGNEEELRDFGFGCMLHDIGKSRIDDKVLNKPEKLTAEEFEEIKRHPVYGYELMKAFVPEISLDVILHHHEKYNGHGYPEGLTGDSITDNAKICAIADVYDALTTNRAYAQARKPFDAAHLMKKEMVGHFEEKKFIEFIYFLSGKR